MKVLNRSGIRVLAFVVGLSVCSDVYAADRDDHNKFSGDTAKSPEELGELFFAVLKDNDKTPALFLPDEVTKKRIAEMASSADEGNRMAASANMKRLGDALLIYNIRKSIEDRKIEIGAAEISDIRFKSKSSNDRNAIDSLQMQVRIKNLDGGELRFNFGAGENINGKWYFISAVPSKVTLTTSNGKTSVIFDSTENTK